MFPCKEERVKWDEYGEFIKLEDYVIPEMMIVEEERKIKAVIHSRIPFYYGDVC